MDVLWGIIILLVMYVIIPSAIIFGTLFALGGGERLMPPGMRPRRTAKAELDTSKVEQRSGRASPIS